MSKEFKSALKSVYKGKVEWHIANAKAVMANPVGIGEHPDILEAVETELKKAAEYHELLEVIDEYL